jgi:hypothetical protein
MTYCTRCKICWHALWADFDSTGDESYEYCPQCMTDQHLDYHGAGDGLVKCRITGRIYNPRTDEDYKPATPLPRPTPRRKIWDETWQEFRDRKEKREDDLLDLYQQLRVTMSNEEAFKEAQNQIPPITRKHHYES